MAREAVVLDTTNQDFAFLSKQVAGASLNSDTRGTEDKVPMAPRASWSENLWPIGTNKLAAVIKHNVGLETIASATMADYISNGARPYVVQVSNLTSYLIVSTGRWDVLHNGSWTNVLTPSSSDEPSVYMLKEQSYMLDANTKLYRFNGGAGVEFSTVVDITASLDFTNTGIAIGNVVSSCAALNYRIFATTSAVYWSAPENDLMFDPQAVGGDAGAGNAVPIGLEGEILFVTGTEDGFYIYTATNIIRASYSQNPNNPWRFSVVKNSSGVTSKDHVLLQHRLAESFIWSATGFAQLGNQGQRQLAPGLTDLLAGDILETYNGTTKKVEIATTGIDLDVQLFIIGKRTICISYGQVGQLKQYILIYDTVTQRWGRLNIPHVMILDIIAITSGGLIFDDWTQNFEDTVESFESFISTQTNQQQNTAAIGILGTDGVIYRLTAIDIYTGLINQDAIDFMVLDNVLVYPNLRLSRRAIANLNEVILHTYYPNYSGDANPNEQFEVQNTLVGAYSDIQVPVVQYQKRPPLMGTADEVTVLEYVEEVQGNNITIVLENINSIAALEVVFKRAGRRW